MQRMAGSKFFGGEAPGEAKYEVSHVIGKGSYGTVVVRASCLSRHPLFPRFLRVARPLPVPQPQSFRWSDMACQPMLPVVDHMCGDGTLLLPGPIAASGFIERTGSASACSPALSTA